MIVLDSSFLIAYHNRDDAHHASASSVMDRLLAAEWGRAVLPEYVFLEVVTVLAARRDLRTAVEVGDTLLRAREVDFVPCSAHFQAAFERFRAQAEERLSFTDAAIVVLARQVSGDGHVATFDADFRAIEGVAAVPG